MARFGCHAWVYALLFVVIAAAVSAGGSSEFEDVVSAELLQDGVSGLVAQAPQVTVACDQPFLLAGR